MQVPSHLSSVLGLGTDWRMAAQVPPALLCQPVARSRALFSRVPCSLSPQRCLVRAASNQPHRPRVPGVCPQDTGSGYVWSVFMRRQRICRDDACVCAHVCAGNIPMCTDSVPTERARMCVCRDSMFT